MALQLTLAQFARLAAYGVQQDVSTADIVFTLGDADCDLIAIESGWIELLSPATHDEAETRVALYGPDVDGVDDARPIADHAAVPTIPIEALTRVCADADSRAVRVHAYQLRATGHSAAPGCLEAMSSLAS